MKKSKGNILIVDGISTGKYFPIILNKQGYDCYAILSEAWKTDKSEDEDKFLQYFKHLNEGSYKTIYRYNDNFNEVIKTLKKFNFKAVIPGGESAVLYTNKLAGALGIKTHNNLNLVEFTRDKYLMQLHLKNNNLRYINFFKAKSIQEVVDWYDCHQYPTVIIKPIFGTASEFNKVCKSREEVIKFAKQIFSYTTFFGQKINECLVEQFIFGDEFVINIASCGGQHKITEIYKYHKPIIDNSPLYDTTTLVTNIDNKIKAVCTYALKVATIFGIQYGASHIEIICDKEGPVLVEIAARVSGGLPFHKSLHQSLGYNPLEVILSSYLDKKAFNKYYKIPYQPTFNFMVKNFIFDQPFPFVKENISNLAKNIESIVDYEIHIDSSCHVIPKTTNLADSPGFIVLANKNYQQMYSDYQILCYLERHYKDLIFSNTKETNNKKLLKVLEKINKQNH